MHELNIQYEKDQEIANLKEYIETLEQKLKNSNEKQNQLELKIKELNDIIEEYKSKKRNSCIQSRTIYSFSKIKTIKILCETINSYFKSINGSY